jgi:hypothetical protein
MAALSTIHDVEAQSTHEISMEGSRLDNKEGNAAVVASPIFGSFTIKPQK